MAVHVETDHAVTIVTIDRRHRRNAVDRATAASLLEAFERFAADDDQRVAVLLSLIHI